ncbi:MAG: SIS domain-containing protein [Chloroflexi bacterium]|nr:SIS domain-containing protein [Chloroflexota bacterium]
MSRGQHTWEEIMSQPDVWQTTLTQLGEQRESLSGFLTRADVEQVVAIGCGSTHYLSKVAASVVARCTGLPAFGLPSSELLLFGETVPSKRTLLLPISRSGTTTETLWALRAFRESARGPVLTITCYPDSPLAQQSDFVLGAPAAQEKSVAQTRSFASMLLMAEVLAGVMGQDDALLGEIRRLPGVLDELLQRESTRSERVGSDLNIERVFILGDGPLYGLACEAMLKMKEMSLTYVEAFHFLEFRHGPMSMVNERTLVVGFVSDTAQSHEARVLEDMSGLGARVMAFVEDAGIFQEWRPDDVVELRSEVGEWARVPLYLPLMQLVAFHRSMAKGLDPDAPHNLSAVIELDAP